MLFLAIVTLITFMIVRGLDFTASVQREEGGYQREKKKKRNNHAIRVGERIYGTIAKDYYVAIESYPKPLWMILIISRADTLAIDSPVDCGIWTWGSECNIRFSHWCHRDAC
jgi:hypothetical protein